MRMTGNFKLSGFPDESPINGLKVKFGRLDPGSEFFLHNELFMKVNNHRDGKSGMTIQI